MTRALDETIILEPAGGDIMWLLNYLAVVEIVQIVGIAVGVILVAKFY